MVYNSILYNKGEKDVPIARGRKFEHDAEGGVLNRTRAIWTIRPSFTGYFFYD